MVKKRLTAALVMGALWAGLAPGAYALSSGSDITFRTTFQGQQKPTVYEGQLWFSGNYFKSQSFKSAPAPGNKGSFHSVIFDAQKQEYYLSTDGEKEYSLYQKTSAKQALALEFLPGYWIDGAMLSEVEPHRLRHYLTLKGFQLQPQPASKEGGAKNPYEIWQRLNTQPNYSQLTVWLHPDEGLPVKATSQNANGVIGYTFEVLQHKTKQTFSMDTFKYMGKLSDTALQPFFSDNVPR